MPLSCAEAVKPTIVWMGPQKKRPFYVQCDGVTYDEGGKGGKVVITVEAQTVCDRGGCWWWELEFRGNAVSDLTGYRRDPKGTILPGALYRYELHWSRESGELRVIRSELRARS